MTPRLSGYLEFLRLTATLIVFLAHGLPLYAPFRAFADKAQLGRDGVVIFFVLSGYVISWCAAERDRSVTAFAINRAARIYSVALPGIALGCTVSLLLYWITDAPTLDYQLRKLWLYLPIYLSFTGTLWQLVEVPPHNFPYWSLNFEVWYYLMFAVWFYLRNRWRWPLLLLLALAAGPEFLLMGLLWLAGSALYFYGGRVQLAQRTARQLLAMTVIGYLLTKFYAVDTVLDSWLQPLWLSTGLTAFVPRQLLGDYWIGALVVLNILAARDALVGFSGQLERTIRFWASYSFSFYLFHIPLYTLLGALLTARDSWLQYLLITTTTVVIILALGKLFEHRKNDYRRAFEALARQFGWWPGPQTAVRSPPRPSS
jgi:peptidoglycan/LPS O-acetylase OafA/YrhL